MKTNEIINSAENSIRDLSERADQARLDGNYDMNEFYSKTINTMNLLVKSLDKKK